MNRRFELELPYTLSDDEAQLVIEILEGLIDVLSRQVQHLDRRLRPEETTWSVPEWMDKSSDKE